MTRREVELGNYSEQWGEGIRFTVTRKGVEISALCEGGFVALESKLVSWDEIDTARAQVDAKETEGK